MKTRWHSARAGSVAAAIALAWAAIAGAAGGAAWASSAPFHDPYANGTIALCDGSGQAVTSGSILDAPFVWRGVSSSAAPQGFENGLVYLYAYQPIQYEDPSSWSGQQLTGGSWYTNPAHPIAQATNADAPLLFFDQAFPPHWNGYVELRMYYSAPGQGVENTSYPAAILQIRGHEWHVVSGGGASCQAGTATALESKTLSAAQLARPMKVTLGASLTVPGPTGGTRPSPTGVAPAKARAVTTTTGAARAASQGTQGSGTQAASAALPASATRHSGPSAAAVVIAVVVGLAAAVAALMSWTVVRRRRPRTGIDE